MLKCYRTQAWESCANPNKSFNAFKQEPLSDMYNWFVVPCMFFHCFLFSNAQKVIAFLKLDLCNNETFCWKCNLYSISYICQAERKQSRIDICLAWLRLGVHTAGTCLRDCIVIKIIDKCKQLFVRVPPANLVVSLPPNEKYNVMVVGFC